MDSSSNGFDDYNRLLLLSWNGTKLNFSSIEEHFRVFATSFEEIKFFRCGSTVEQAENDFCLVFFVDQSLFNTAISEGKVVVQNEIVSILRVVEYNGIEPSNVLKCLSSFSYINDEQDLIRLNSLVAAISQEKIAHCELIHTKLVYAFNLLIFDPIVRPFGSFVSSQRKTGESDLDIEVWFRFSPDQPVARNKSELIVPKQGDREDFVSKILSSRLNSADLESLTARERVKLIDACLADERCRLYPELTGHSYLHRARVPIILLNFFDKLSIDISLDNDAGIFKSDILDLFIEKDESKQMGIIVNCFRFWAKSNGLFGRTSGPKEVFNSYMINHILIHFVQHSLQKKLLHSNLNRDERCKPYSTSEIASTKKEFFKKLFIYLSTIDFSTKVIYNDKLMDKTTVMATHQLTRSPLVICDPNDLTHNIANRVSSKTLSLFKVLIRYSLHLIKNKPIRAIFDAESEFKKSMQSVERDVPPNGTFRFDLPTDFLSLDESLLCEIILAVLTIILRFEISSEFDSNPPEALMREGIDFRVTVKSWLGRRQMRREMHSRDDFRRLSDLQLEALMSKQMLYEQSDCEPTRVRIRLIGFGEGLENRHLRIEAQLLFGNRNDVSEAMQYAIQRFLSNYAPELVKNPKFYEFPFL